MFRECCCGEIEGSESAVVSGGRGCRGSVGRFPSDGGDIGANYEVGEYLVRKAAAISNEGSRPEHVFAGVSKESEAFRGDGLMQN